MVKPTSNLTDIGTYEVSIVRYKDGIKDLVNFEPLKIWASRIVSKLLLSEFTEGKENKISITSIAQNIDDGSEVTFDLVKYKNSELVEIQEVDSIATTVNGGSATGVIKLPSDLEANVYYVRTTSNGMNYYNKIVIKGDLSEESEEDVKVSLKVMGYEGTIIEKCEVKTSLYNLNPYLSEKDGAGTIPGDWEESNFEGVSLAHVLVKALEEKGVSYGHTRLC